MIELLQSNALHIPLADTAILWYNIHMAYVGNTFLIKNKQLSVFFSVSAYANDEAEKAGSFLFLGRLSC